MSLWRNLPNLSALVVISAVTAISLMVSPFPTADSQEVWNEVSPSPQVRGEAQGAVVGGKLYVFGGYVDFSPCCPSTTRSDAYDPATNAWTRIADLPEPISHAPVVVDGDTAYLLGGFVGDHPGPSTDHVWKYDTATNTWSEGPPLPERRGAGGGAIVGRTIHYFGGVDRPAGQNVYVDEEEHWALDLDAAEPAWEARAPLPNPRNHLAGAALDGKVYAVGGQHGGDEAGGNQGEVDEYDPATNAWARVADLPAPRGHIGATVLGGRLYAIGGSVNGGTNGLPSAEVTAFDVRADAWAVQTPLPAARKSPVVGAIESREGLLVSSTGNGSGATATTWIGMSIECTLVGTSASETLTGTVGPDAICGRGGNDTIKGLGGDDVLWGEVGTDNLQGGPGSDTLHGGLGIDTGSYTASLTAVSASLATNSSTGEGSDTFSGVENLSGSPKADTLTGSAANNKLTGGGGSDTESGGLGDDTVIGSGGVDFLYGQGGNDTVNSKDSVNGNDTLRGGAGTDTKITDTQEKSILGFP